MNYNNEKYVAGQPGQIQPGQPGQPSYPGQPVQPSDPQRPNYVPAQPGQPYSAVVPAHITNMSQAQRNANANTVPDTKTDTNQYPNDPNPAINTSDPYNKYPTPVAPFNKVGTNGEKLTADQIEQNRKFEIEKDKNR